MQTFLPSTDFEQSAKWIDRPGRLGKQRLEGIDCLKLNLHLNYGLSRELLNFPEWLIKRYGNHPTRLMWAGYEWSLWKYCRAIVHEWRNAGYRDCCLDELMRLYPIMAGWKVEDAPTPHWLTEEFASNHRSVLLGKALETVKKAAKNLNINWGEDEYCEVIKDGQYTRFVKARAVNTWYHNLKWQEKPAKRVLINGKMRWPYLWPESEATQ